MSSTNTSSIIPQSFIDFITPALPNHLSINDLITACQTSLRFSIRINTLKINHSDFITMMTPLGWEFSTIPWCVDGFWITLPNEFTAPGKLPEHLTGLFYIQEASSMMPPSALFHNSPSTPQKVLDLAAAPGSKTTQLATLMANKGLLVANELSSSRVKALHSNLQRLGVSNTLISHFDGCVHGEYLENTFDAILLDAPCSGEGTVRKDPDAFKNWNLAHIKEISDIQKKLIRSAFMALKPGGELVYSTCALNSSENQGVCEWLLSQYPNNAQVVSLSDLFIGADKALTSEGYLHIWPQIYNSEGFFVAKFTKLATTNDTSNPVFRSKFPFTPIPKKQQAIIMEALASLLILQDDFNQHLFTRDNEVWYFPEHCNELIKNMRFARHGVKVLDIKPKQMIVTHDALTIWGKISILINREQCVDFLKGKDIAIENTQKEKGEVVLGYQGQPIGLGKWVGNKIKNKLPRNLVNDNVNL